MKTTIRFYLLVILPLCVSLLLPAQTVRLPKAHSLQPHTPKYSWDKPSHIQSKDHNPISKTSSGSVDTAWVRHYGADFTPSEGYSTAVAVDRLGNVYVTGYTIALLTNNDYATIKYNSNGDTIWVVRYNGPGKFSDDRAAALALDASGNVYVTGTSGGDYTTVKYNSAGVQQWVASYNGPGNIDDGAIALAVDASGNVFVTGSSYGAGTVDYATVKYNSAGIQLWVARYNGPGNIDDGAIALAVDASGNVFVTGSSHVLYTNNSDYATVKYNSAGVQQWVASYNGPGNSWDEAVALALDTTGNVFVTGSSGTIKYNGNGVQQWIVNKSANDLALDASGNVYVTGESGTIKYNSNGIQQWVTPYSGNAIVFDAAGNFYVMKGFPNTDLLKCSSNGDTIWVATTRGNAAALAVDSSGNVYETGFQYWGPDGPGWADYRTIKHNSAGIEQWIARYEGPGNYNDAAAALAVDGSGNVYVTGSRTIKYNNNGLQQWVGLFGGGALALDASGNVYTSGGNTTVKYNSIGDTVWVDQYEGLWTFALALDASGNVYVTGGSWQDFVTVKYNSIGVLQWDARYPGPENSYLNGSAIAVDAFGNVFVTGSCATIKYNSAGVQQWVASVGGNALALDASGNIYVAGWKYDSLTLNDYATIKYNSNGDTVWIARYNGPGNDNDEAYAIAIDTYGNVYVTGNSHGLGGPEYTTVKYNPAGVQQWVARQNAVIGIGFCNYPPALALDATSNVYVTGRCYDSLTSYDYLTIKYNSTGVEQWVARYNGPGSSDEGAVALAVDAPGNVYVTGMSHIIRDATYNIPQYGMSTTIKYAQSPTFVNQHAYSVPNVFVLEQNYPNPFNPSTTIRYALPSSSNVKIIIYDLLGREVATLVNEEQTAGWKEVQWNGAAVSSGIYFYKLTAGNYVGVKKLMLLK